MARKDLAPLDAEIRKRLVASKPVWADRRAQWPHVAESTFSYRVKKNRSEIAKEQRTRRQRLADPFASAEVKRDAYKLFCAIDLIVELQECFSLAETMRTQSISRSGEIRPFWFDQSMAVRRRLIFTELKILRQRNEWALFYSVNWHLEALARAAGPGACQRLAGYRRKVISTAELEVLAGLVGLLGDARLMVAPGAKQQELRSSIKRREEVIMAIGRWGVNVLTEAAATKIVEAFIDDFRRHPRTLGAEYQVRLKALLDWYSARQRDF